MNSLRRGVGFGVFLLVVGIIWILVNTGVLTWSVMDALFVLWPLVLVAIGVDIIFKNKPLIRGTAWIVALAVVIGYSYFHVDKVSDNKNYTGGSDVRIENRAGTKTANLRIAFGGARIDLDSSLKSGSNLLEAELKDDKIIHSSTFGSEDSNAELIFEKKSYGENILKTDTNIVNSFHLNNSVVWNLDVDTGAVDANFDLSGLNVGDMAFDIGAANMKLKLGSYDSKLRIKAGASNIDIVIPADTGIKVNMSGGLSSDNTDEPGWTKSGQTRYSPGYDTKAHKIEADIDMGVGRLTVRNAV